MFHHLELNNNNNKTLSVDFYKETNKQDFFIYQELKDRR